jgi:hypothetical protein
MMRTSPVSRAPRTRDRKPSLAAVAIIGRPPWQPMTRARRGS